MLAVLESIQEFHEPGRLDGCQNVTLDQHVLDLVHFGERALAHLFEGADLLRVGFASEIDRAVAALADLGEDAKLLHTQTCTALAQQHALATIVGDELALVLCGWKIALASVGAKGLEALLAAAKVAKEVD